jgi:hypothetical protein
VVHTSLVELLTRKELQVHQASWHSDPYLSVVTEVSFSWFGGYEKSI